MKRDEKGRYNYQRRGIRFDDHLSDTNWADDNLTPSEDDELDDESGYHYFCCPDHGKAWRTKNIPSANADVMARRGKTPNPSDG